MFAIITENDNSQWSDKTGVHYHFPVKYKSILLPKTRIIYYKGKIKDKSFRDKRLHDCAYYFGYGEIADIEPDEKSGKKDLYAYIENYIAFSAPVLAKKDNIFIEHIPDNKKNNYWRDGVRKVTEDIFNSILQKSDLTIERIITENDDLKSYIEGNRKALFTTKYERNTVLRRETIKEKGTICKCCNFDFEAFYGEIGAGYTHIHHTKPLYSYGGESSKVCIDDLEPVCPNCHAMLHKNKNSTLTIDQLREKISINRKL